MFACMVVLFLMNLRNTTMHSTEQQGHIYFETNAGAGREIDRETERSVK
jgi:hypothetical protein